MWTVVGPFDGEEEKKIDFKKTKLLRPGNSYVISRKTGPLVIKHPSISRKHIVIEVGQCTEEDLENPEFIPKLTIRNPSAQARKCTHADGTDFALNKDGSAALKDGDQVWVLQDTHITVKWDKLACCCPPTITDVKHQDCAKLSISITPKPHPSVNYHLTPTYSLTPVIATSLLNAATFVKPAWLTELIAHYAPLDTPDPGKEYHIPSTSKYRPTLSPALPSSLKNHRSWEPNEARAGMLKGHRVVFVGERGREASEDYRELVKQGGGTYECCAVQGERQVLHDVLAKAQGKDAKIALVADASAMVAAVGQDVWDGIVEEATGYGLRFIPADKIVQAVAHVDLANIDCTVPKNGSTQSSASIPDVVLNTHPDEPSAPPSHPPSASAITEPDPYPAAAPPRVKLVRRAASKQLSAEPDPSSSTTANTTPAPDSGAPSSSDPPQEENPFRLRRSLVRRTLAKANDNMIVGIGDTTMAIDGAIPHTDEAPKAAVDFLPPPRRPIGLKRRHGIATPAPQPPPPPSQLVVEKSSAEEPPHKRFKALFEESDPDRIAQQSQVPTSEGDAGLTSDALSSQTQTESALRTQSRVPELASVPEEDGEGSAGTSASPAAQRSQKRKARDETADIEMQDAENARPAKRRSASREPTAPPQSQAASAPKVFTNAANKPASGAQKAAGQRQSRGAVPGQPDTDEAFLKAVASTKRGKKHEDDFDREFNELRISKPEVQRADPEEQWKVLDEFEDDKDVRGNFMVVVEMDLVRDRREGASVLTGGGGRRDWKGRPNFKKFKKKAIGEPPQPVELFPSNDDDTLGFKDEADDDGPNFPRSQSLRRLGHDPFSPAPKPDIQPQNPRKQQHDSDSEVESAILPKSQKTQPRSKASQSRGAQPGASRTQKKSTLFVPEEEDEDDEQMEVDKDASDDSDVDISPRSTLRTQTQRRSQWSSLGRRQPPPDDDSADDMTFKGFGTGRSQRGTQRR